MTFCLKFIFFCPRQSNIVIVFDRCKHFVYPDTYTAPINLSLSKQPHCTTIYNLSNLPSAMIQVEVLPKPVSFNSRSNIAILEIQTFDEGWRRAGRCCSQRYQHSIDFCNGVLWYILVDDVWEQRQWRPSWSWDFPNWQLWIVHYK